MHRVQTKLAAGKKRPYTMWTFLIIPDAIARQWGPGRKAVRGTLSGQVFRGTASRGEGVLRVAIARDILDRANVRRGDTVDVALELDQTPRRIRLPKELRTVFADHPNIAAMYDKMPPSHRRAWAEYVGEAKQPDTRKRRAKKALAGIRARAFP